MKNIQYKVVLQHNGPEAPFAVEEFVTVRASNINVGAKRALAEALKGQPACREFHSLEFWMVLD